MRKSPAARVLCQECLSRRRFDIPQSIGTSNNNNNNNIHFYSANSTIQFSNTLYNTFVGDFARLLHAVHNFFMRKYSMI